MVRCNYNGQIILEPRVEHGFCITNAFYKHRKKNQIQAWYRWNNIEQSSQNDYIITRKSKRRHIRDVKVILNVNVDEDHHPVIVYTRQKPMKWLPTRRGSEIINLRKLNTDLIREEVKQDMAGTYERLEDESNNVDEAWQYFKKCLSDSLKDKRNQEEKNQMVQ